MRPVGIRCRFISLCIALALGCVQAEGSNVWFQKRVTWQAGTDPRVWEAAVVSPNGKEHYRLALVPLWAVEGGIVGIEILVSSPEHPDDNLLGRRENDVPQRFVVTVEELENGINKSRFGANRVFKVRRAKLRVEILGSRLGKGVGDCESCTNIQEFAVEFSFEGK
jgi:hypothetical protein